MVRLVSKKALREHKAKALESGASNWSKGIGDQKPKPLDAFLPNVKMLSMGLIEPDEKNSREQLVSDEEYTNGPKPQIPYDEAAQIRLIAELEVYFKNDANESKKTQSYLETAQLAGSIESPENLHQPIKVREYRQNRFLLVFGHRRRLAHILLNANQILTIIESAPMDALSHILAQRKENSDRVNLKLKEELKVIKRLISEWESKHNKKVSITKLMVLLNEKKTKTAWILAVIKELSVNEQFSKAISQEIITSLEVAYYLSATENKQHQQAILNRLLNKEKFNHKQLITLIRSPSTAIRAPDTQSKTDNYGLKVTRKTNINVLSKAIRLILKTSEFRELASEFSAINLESKQGVEMAWKKIFQLLDN
jgi:ParB-like chromosome segregation protein Spo0J